MICWCNRVSGIVASRHRPVPNMSLLLGYLIICITYIYFSHCYFTQSTHSFCPILLISFMGIPLRVFRLNFCFSCSVHAHSPAQNSHTYVITSRRGQREHMSKCTRRTEATVGFVPRTERRKQTAWHRTIPASPWCWNSGRELQRERGQWNSAKAFSLLGKQHALVCVRAVSWDATVSLVSCPFAHRPGRLSEPAQ